MDPNIFSNSQVRVGVLVLSGSASLLDDVGQSAWHRIGGQRIEEAFPPHSYTLLRILVLPGGDKEEAAGILRDWCDAPNASYRCRLIMTVGGDGFGASDIAPEAVRAVVDREAPGLAERLRSACVEAADNPNEARARTGLSRSVAGVRGGTLIVNLPSCFDEPADAIEVLKPLLPEALAALG